MILMNLWTTASLIILSETTSSVFSTIQRGSIYKDQPLYILFDRQVAQKKESPQIWELQDFLNSAEKNKRAGLSVGNNVDTIRQRVMLELARRKAIQNEMQISENRGIIGDAGKRSGLKYSDDLENSYILWYDNHPENAGVHDNAIDRLKHLS